MLCIPSALYTKCLVCVIVLCIPSVHLSPCSVYQVLSMCPCALSSCFVCQVCMVCWACSVCCSLPIWVPEGGGGGEGDYHSAMALGWREGADQAEQEVRTLVARSTSRWECASHCGSPRQDPHPGPAAVCEACVLPGDSQVRGHRRMIKSELASWVHVNVAHPISFYCFMRIIISVIIIIISVIIISICIIVMFIRYIVSQTLLGNTLTCTHELQGGQTFTLPLPRPNTDINSRRGSSCKLLVIMYRLNGVYSCTGYHVQMIMYRL